ncbi:MAG TPA: hypothetical protein VIS07_06690 [Candidatus Binatia bacterium]
MADDAREVLLSDAASVPVAPCPRCEREVVVYVAADAADDAGYACVHCDGPVRGVYLVSESELDALGYAVADPLRAGCGTGCAAGGCGVRRPTGA